MTLRSFSPFMLSLAALLLVSCASSTSETLQSGKASYPMELQWFRKSVEYDLLCIQIYRNAWQVVKSSVENSDGPWAIVMDVDETVLDNSRYQEILWEKNKRYPYFWDEWIRRGECPAVPGAKTFLDSLRTLGPSAQVVFITNRTSSADIETKQNLIAAGLWQPGDMVMGKRDSSDSKEIRRQEVLNGTGRCQDLPPRRIVALFGDQIGDFVEYQFTTLNALEQEQKTKPDYGTKYFLLPNPLYGYWERNYQ